MVWVACAVACASGSALAQQPMAAPQVMGTVATKDASVTGGLEVKGDKARLMNNTSVTANGRTAQVKLQRGGDLLVCSTSQVHLLHSGGPKALLFGLDRGALEIHTAADARDVILTPDIRFTVESKGSFDLGLRVTRNGDTCVDNSGGKAPVLMLTDSFSQASYRLMPQQHVLFEHGNLRQVVDNESSPCGCPGSGGGERVESDMSPAQKASAEHPFPAAASQGLTPEQPVENSPTGEKDTQVSTTFAYGQGAGAPPSTQPMGAADQGGSATPSMAPMGDAAPELPPPSSPKVSLGAKLKHFFYRIFHPSAKPV
jgi:hypothetical protein